MSKPKLKPCPWCGETPFLGGYFGVVEVQCVNDECGVLPAVGHENEADAIRIWNTRKRAKKAKP